MSAYAISTLPHRLLDRIRAECRESPGLHVTASQAARLWGVDPVTCALILAELVHTGFMARTPGGRFLCLEGVVRRSPAGAR